MSAPPSNQTAELSVTTQPFSVKAKVEVTPAGLLAIAVLVGGILLGTAVIVAVAKKR
ncbi:conserved hypothetical protein [Burkholderiales bacterium 8X]|nr:conserved hypothetical protein [Burkholderiales bacterium 8X]